LVIRMILRFHA